MTKCKYCNSENLGQIEQYASSHNWINDKVVANDSVWFCYDCGKVTAIIRRIY